MSLAPADMGSQPLFVVIPEGDLRLFLLLLLPEGNEGFSRQPSPSGYTTLFQHSLKSTLPPASMI